MMKSKIIVNRNYPISEVDKRIYSGFIEHLGRAVYEGIYQPEHESSDADGFRGDVLELIRELDMPLTRYPGGNFVSAYRWEDGVGPRDERPARLELAWEALEPNLFGTDEFVRWCRKAGTAPMLAVNLGTRGAAEAQQLVEYCNFPGGTALSDWRRGNGSEEPHNIKLWCLGNEMDGPWQFGQRSADDYGRVCREAAKLMKTTDPEIELVVCGSSHKDMATLGEWEETVLSHTYEYVEYISVHQYFANRRDRTADYLAGPEAMSEYIDRIAASCDAVGTRKKSAKKIMLSFDEWNVWYHSMPGPKPPKWMVGRPILEDIYNTEDALLVGMLMMTLLNHSDRVKIACIAQSVNVIAPIMTSKNGKAWRQTIFYPFAYTSKYGRGIAMKTIAESDCYEADYDTCNNPAGKEISNVPYLYSSVIHNPENNEMVIFVCNRHLRENMTLETVLEHFTPVGVIEHITLYNQDLKAVNSEEHETVHPKTVSPGKVDGNRIWVELPPASWNMIRIRLA